MEIERVAWVVGGKLVKGGTETFLMNYYRHFDPEKVQVDFVVHGFEKGIYEKEIGELGGEVFYVPVKSRDYQGNRKALATVFKNHKYRAVHAHMNAMSAPVLGIAKKYGVPLRIAHAHASYHQISEKGLGKLVKTGAGEVAKRRLPLVATDLFACSRQAGEWLYGSSHMDKVRVIPNAIEVEKFRYSEEARTRLRKQLAYSGKRVIGHVGRFDGQKNHAFLVDVFAALHKRSPAYVLLLIGEGKGRDAVRQKVQEYGLENDVLFAGGQEDVSPYLQAMDVFVLPSTHEGLGIALIEAQAAGLPCIASDAVPEEVNLTGNVQFLSLEQSLEHWADAVEAVPVIFDREPGAGGVMEAGYDIAGQAARLQEFYLTGKFPE